MSSATEAPSDRHHASKSADHAVADEPHDHPDGKECTLVVPNNVHQRRRVNPESLALRLGPDLVRDLDALITPGNTEMPSFAVRKELQERYNIDRRHIYDYFHSRGLRVVKEDKHGNPMPTKDLPTPLPNLRPLRQAPIKSSRSHPSYSVAAEKKLFKPRGVTKVKPGRPRNVPSANLKTLPVTCEINQAESTDTIAPVSEHHDSFPGGSPTAIYVTVNPLLPHTPSSGLVEKVENHTFTSVVNPLGGLVGYPVGYADYTCRHWQLVVEKSQEPAGGPDRPVLTDDDSISWTETVASPCSASGNGLLLPHAKALTRDERHAIYEELTDSLGPAHGIQECQGTYRKYMETRTKLYFEALLPVPYHYSQQPARTSTPSDRKLSLGTNEFRHWLSETRFLKRDGANDSPRLCPTHRNANMTKRQDVAGVTDEQLRHESVPYWAQTLDELFPLPGENLSSSDPLTDSPVVRTREDTRMSAPAQGFADKCNAEDRSLFLATSHPSLPIFPVPSVSEIRQTGASQIHGVPGFPGQQDVKARMLVVEMDGRPQLSEHVSCVARPGSHSILNDTQRRGRKTSNGARIYPPSCSPRKSQMRDLDRIRTRPHTSRDARIRTPSAAGDI